MTTPQRVIDLHQEFGADLENIVLTENKVTFDAVEFGRHPITVVFHEDGSVVETFEDVDCTFESFASYEANLREHYEAE